MKRIENIEMINQPRQFGNGYIMFDQHIDAKWFINYEVVGAKNIIMDLS